MSRTLSELVAEENIKDRLKQAEDLILKIRNYLGASADSDFNLWKETEKYCKENNLIEVKTKRAKESIKLKKCPFCKSLIESEDEPCMFCDGKGCRLCAGNNGKTTIVWCTSKDCILSDDEEDGN